MVFVSFRLSFPVFSAILFAVERLRGISGGGVESGDGNKQRMLSTGAGESILPDSGGSQQIRTAVDGFADRYLTTRSGNQCACRKRFPADSNCCGRFCRPLPNHSVREPRILFRECKGTTFFQKHNHLCEFSCFFAHFSACPDRSACFIPLSLQSDVQPSHGEAFSGWRNSRYTWRPAKKNATATSK